ncbi:MAG TPA: TRAM domain-containing protein [Mycobacterium sp.]|nr:TRAM domain-containing protein [Mycobacterium sp.]
MTDELVLTTGAPANGGSCVAHLDGRVVFVRYALPDETVRARVTSEASAYLHAEAVEILEPSPHRIPSLCPIASPDGAGCCDLAFAEPDYARLLKGQVLVNQLERLAGFRADDDVRAESVGSGEPTGWRTRVRLGVGYRGRIGFRRHHSNEIATAPDCGQLPPGMLDSVRDRTWPLGAEVHVVIDDDGQRHVVRAGPWEGRRSGFARPNFEVVEGNRDAVQRVGERVWHVPVTGFWQSHRDAAAVYSALVAAWADLAPGMTAWDLYGGAGLFAATLADGVGEIGQVLTIDMGRAASRTAARELADLPQVQVVNASVRKALEGLRERADVAVVDPPRKGAGKDVVKLIADAGVPRVIHIGCEVASFARDLGLYQAQGYAVEELRVFDAFPLTHHVEVIALLQR